MADELARIAQAPDQKSRVEEYRSWLHKTVQTGSGPSCDIFIDHSEPLLDQRCPSTQLAGCLGAVCLHVTPAAASAACHVHMFYNLIAPDQASWAELPLAFLPMPPLQQTSHTALQHVSQLTG